MNKVIAIVNKSHCNYGAHVIVGDGIAATVGNTLTELRQKMKDALDGHLEVMKDYGDEIPKPFDEEFEIVFKFDKSMLKPAKRAKKLGLGKPVGKIIQQQEDKKIQPVHKVSQYIQTGKILQMHKEKLQMA